MKKAISRLAWAGALLAIFGCATVSAPGTTPLPPDKLAAAVVERLVNAYGKRDVPGFMTLVSARYLDSYEVLQAGLEDTLGTVVSAKLDVRPERTWRSENDMVLVDAAWTKTIVKSGAPNAEVTSGRVTLTFIRYGPDVLKLFSQKGNPVFP